MKLILTIGMHGSATAKIWRFCAANDAALRRAGYLFLAADHRSCAASHLALELCRGQGADVARQLDKAHRAAQRAKCHSVLLMADPFYAMTALLLDVPGKRPEQVDYWASEKELVDRLRGCCGRFEPALLAYLCPQDEFAAAAYTEMVMAPAGIGLTYDAFVAAARPAFDYDRHFGLWREAFGADHVTLRNAAANRNRVIEDFCATALDGHCADVATGPEPDARPGPARDVLEVKRIFNRTTPDRALARVAARAFDIVAADMPDAPGHRALASPAARRRDFADFAAGNAALAERHGFAPLPTVGDAEDPADQPMSLDRAVEVYLRYRRVMDRPGLRAELALRRLAARIPGGRRLPGLRGLI